MNINSTLYNNLKITKQNNLTKSIKLLWYQICMYLLLYLVFDDNRFNYRYPFFNFFILFINILQTNSFNCNLIKQKSNSFNCNLIKQRNQRLQRNMQSIMRYRRICDTEILISKYNSRIDIYMIHLFSIILLFLNILICKIPYSAFHFSLKMIFNFVKKSSTKN